MSEDTKQREGRKDAPQNIQQSQGGVYIGGNVTGSTVVGRDFFQQVYSYLPVPDVVKENAKPITVIYAAICELLAIIATVADIRKLQLERFPPMLTPYSWQQHLPLPSPFEILGIFIKNNIFFFGLGVLVAIGIIAALWYVQKGREAGSTPQER